MNQSIPIVVPIDLPEAEAIDDPSIVMPKRYRGFGRTPKRIRGLIRLAMLVALARANDERRNAHRAIALLTHSLADITPELNAAQRQQLARRWVVCAVVGGKRNLKDE